MIARLISLFRLAAIPAVAAVPLLIGAGSAAAAGSQPAAIAVAAPANVKLGQTVMVEARLTDASGAIVKATVQFAIPSSFLKATSDMVVATGVTNGSGLATATFQARSSGSLQVKAVFAGDTNHAAASATAPLTVVGNTELYTPDKGVQLAGITSSPFSANSQASHWVLSGWPIGAILVIVWSTYGTAVYFMSRISAEALEPVEGEGAR